MVTFSLAEPRHEESCRVLARTNAMGSSTQLRLCREPNYFAAEKIGNRWSDVIVCTEKGSDMVYGIASRTGKRMHVFGEVKDIGYLSQLRSYDGPKGSPMVVFRGYQFLRQLHETDTEHPVPFYFTTIFSENTHARELLEKDILGLPRYSPVTELCTYALGAPSYAYTTKAQQAEWSRSSEALQQVLDAANTWSATHDLAPAYDAGDQEWLKLVDWQVVQLSGDGFRARALVADMSPVRQVMIEKHSRANTFLSRVRTPLQKVGFSKIAKEGEELALAHILALSFEGNEEFALEALVRAVRGHRQFKNSLAVVGFDSRSALSGVLEPLALSITKSMLYVVSWDTASADDIATRATRVHIDSGTL